VSQMGVIAAVLGMGLATGDGGIALSVGFYAAHHTLVKGALFLAVGIAQVTSARRLWPVLLPACVLALGLGGLPLTGGALAKLVVKPALGEGIVGLLATLSSAGTTLLMLHFLSRLKAASALDAPRQGASPLSLPWLAMAFASVAVPWALYLTVMGGALSDALAPAALWSSVWPVLLGGIFAVGLWRWGGSLPEVPEGDVVVLVAEDAKGLARAVGSMLERLDGLLRQWPVAGVSLLAVAVVLAALMLTGR
jgi:multicomponent Na+:H+ antiporter subunit A